MDQDARNLIAAVNDRLSIFGQEMAAINAAYSTLLMRAFGLISTQAQEPAVAPDIQAELAAINARLDAAAAALAAG